MGGSTVRSQSVFSAARSESVCTSVVEEWDLPHQAEKKLPTHRGLAKLNVKEKGPKPLVARPTKNASKAYLPAPSPSAFREPTHLSMNQKDFKELAPVVAINQGPTRGPSRKKEGHRHFSKACEQQVI